MKQYTVEITDEALADMEHIYNHIAYVLLAPENAMGQYNRIADEIIKLDVFPERFRIMDSEPEHSKGIHRMLVDNYSVFYVIKDDRVIVTDVLYSASDIELKYSDRRGERALRVEIAVEQMENMSALECMFQSYSIFPHSSAR